MSNPDDIPIEVRQAFTFMQASAVRAGVPHADTWSLIFTSVYVWPWRVIDTATDAPESSSIVFALGAQTPREAKLEMQARGLTLRGMWEIAEKGYGPDLIARARAPHPWPRLERK